MTKPANRPFHSTNQAHPYMHQNLRNSTRVYAKGAARRESLLDAAAMLLGDNELDGLSLNDIAKQADIPVGSAYHFFANAQDVFAALAQRFMATLFTVLSHPYSVSAAESWQTLFDAAIDRAASLYEEHPAYRQLILSGKSPPEIKRADRENDKRISQLMIDVIGQYFQINNHSFNREVFFFATEIVDLMFSLSVMRHGFITPKMLQEAKTAGRSYLLQYLPEDIAPVSAEEQ